MRLSIVAVMSLLFWFSTGQNSSADSPLKIVLDPGHGGEDPGCIGPGGTQEKDVALNVGLLVEKILRDSLPNVQVFLTRRTDTFITLHDRAQMANKLKADLFISLHCNSSCRRVKNNLKCNQQAEGLEIYALGLHRTKENLEVAMRENSVILMEKNYQLVYDNFDPTSEEHYIILSLRQNIYIARSLHLGALIIKKCEARGIPTRGIRQAGFWVLYKTAMPAILIELDFLTSPHVEKKLTSPDYVKHLAYSIYEGIREFLEALSSPVVSSNHNNNDIIASSPISQSFDTLPNRGLYYSVQILASVNRVPSPLNIGGGLKIFEIKDGPLYKYTHGLATSYREALQIKEKLIQEGFSDAFIIGILDGKVIPAGEAMELEKRKPPRKKKKRSR